MMGHVGGEKHSRYLMELSFLPKGVRVLDMGAGDGATVRLLRDMDYIAKGIDLAPRGDNVTKGDYLHAPFADASFDGIISECSFYMSGDILGALTEAARMLKKGGKLVFSDVCGDAVALLGDVRKAGFAVRHIEDLTDEWKEYYLEALWREENVPKGKGLSYVLMICERV